MSKPIKILVADDNASYRRVLKGLLTMAGYEVLEAEDGLAAFEMAVIEKPDIVITDGLMPKMHGFLVCKTVKQLEPPPKVIVLTAVYTKPEYRLEVMRKYGADELFIKPCSTAELVACIENMLLGPGEQPDETVNFQMVDL
jgi:DNA-binding response OmpR family regulator